MLQNNEIRADGFSGLVNALKVNKVSEMTFGYLSDWHWFLDVDTHSSVGSE